MKKKPLTHAEQIVLRVLPADGRRSMTIGSVASFTDLTYDKSRRALGGLLVRGLVDEDRGWWRRVA